MFKKIVIFIILVIFLACNIVGVFAYDDREVWDSHYNEGKTYYDSWWNVMEYRNDMYIYCPYYTLVLAGCGNNNPTVSYSFIEVNGNPYPMIIWDRYGEKDTSSLYNQYYDLTPNIYDGPTLYTIYCGSYYCWDTFIDVIE